MYRPIFFRGNLPQILNGIKNENFIDLKVSLVHVHVLCNQFFYGLRKCIQKGAMYKTVNRLEESTNIMQPKEFD
jgi:hypothetical protein